MSNSYDKLNYWDLQILLYNAFCSWVLYVTPKKPLFYLKIDLIKSKLIIYNNHNHFTINFEECVSEL